VPDWLTFPFVADLASLVSLAVSGYAAYAIATLRSQIVDRMRLPALIEGLAEHGKNLAGFMGTYADASTKDKLLLELTICETKLRLVKSKVQRPVNKRVRELRREILKYQRKTWLGFVEACPTREQAWIIYSKLTALIEELNNVLEERKIGG